MAEAVSTVIKLAPFWSADPALWFVQAEAQFATRNITTETTKFRHIVATLAPEIATEVRDLLLLPPENPYTSLKAALIKRVGVTEDVRLAQLLKDEPLGDRRPSQLLRRMRQLLGTSTMDETILRRLFLTRLPPACRARIAGRNDVTDLNALSEIADEVNDATTFTEVAAPVTMTIDAINEIKNEVNALRREFQTQTRRSTSQQQRPGAIKLDANALCWYHSTFGARARKCQEGCSYAHAGNARPAQ